MKRIVTFSKLGKMGRFCNGAFQVASTIGIARKSGFDFAFPLWRNYDGHNFESGLDIDIHSYLEHPLPLYDGVELPERFVDWGYHDVVLTESTSLYGHMQSSRYFNHCIDEVRYYLRMKDEPPQNEYVALHFRAGDYTDIEGYHPRMTMAYYAPAMRMFPGAKFLIFSDDLLAAQQMAPEMLQISTNLTYAQGNYLEDFALMKRCKSFIISNSSYSAMAALLGEHPEKRVIAPRPWFGKAASINGEDIYDPSWTVLNWA